MPDASGPESRRLKIAFVVDRFGNRFGGAEAYGVALMRELAARHDVTVFAREYDEACDLKLPYIALRSWRGWPSWIRVLLFAIRAGRATRPGFDIVHSHMNGWCGDVDVVHVTPVRYNWRVRALPAIKRWLSYVSPRVGTYLALEAQRVAMRRGHRAVAVSDLIADQLTRAYGSEASYPVIPPGVAPPQGDLIAQRLHTRRALGFTNEEVVCLLVARNPMRKGLPTVLQAMARLPAHYKLLVVGSNAATREYLHKKSCHAALAERVRLVGETADVAPYYASADIYVHPTLNDSFGMAPLEAMSFGLPVVLSPAPWCGFAQYVNHGADALVLDHPENAEQLATYIASIIDDENLRVTLARGGDGIVERHSWTAVAQRYEVLYGEIIEERR